MKIKFDEIIDSYKDKTAVVIGHGNSANKYLKNYKDFLKDKVVIGCNLWFRHYDILPNFWMFSNPDLNMKVMSQAINHFYKNTNNVVVYSDVIDLTDKKIVKEEYKCVRYLPYDNIHFNKTKCIDGACCIHLDVERNTIQEELANYCNVNMKYSMGNTVLLHAMVISVLIGCSNIEVIGFDKNYRTGYCNDLKQYDKFDLDTKLFDVPPYNILDQSVYNIDQDYNIINQSAKNIKVKMVIL